MTFENHPPTADLASADEAAPGSDNLAPRNRRLIIGAVVGVAVLVLALLTGLIVARGSEPVLAGYERSPEPVIEASLPAVNRGGDDWQIRAEPDRLLVVFFGFANCPDICPTTLADSRRAFETLGDRADRVDLAMVTIDPDRDTPEALSQYVEAFVPDAIALRTDDQSRLLDATFEFGVSYQVETNAEGDIEVGHTPNLFVVDDTGTLKLTWPFGVLSDDIAADLGVLLDRVDAR